MLDFVFNIPPNADPSQVEALVESMVSLERLEMTMKSSLAKHPGSVHWHFRKPEERGTLEITWSPRENKLWASIQAGRRAEWIEPCVLRIKARVEEMPRGA
jgi:hypothetical protein